MLSLFRYIPDFIVMGRELVQELLDPILLTHRVHVGDLLLGDRGEVEVHLQHNITVFTRKKGIFLTGKSSKYEQITE